MLQMLVARVKSSEAAGGLAMWTWNDMKIDGILYSIDGIWFISIHKYEEGTFSAGLIINNCYSIWNSCMVVIIVLRLALG